MERNLLASSQLRGGFLRELAVELHSVPAQHSWQALRPYGRSALTLSPCIRQLHTAHLIQHS